MRAVMREALFAFVLAEPLRLFAPHFPVEVAPPVYRLERVSVSGGAAPITVTADAAGWTARQAGAGPDGSGDFLLKCGAVAFGASVGAVAVAGLRTPLRAPATARAARVPGARAPAPLMRAPLKRQWETAQVPLGRVSLNPLTNLAQMRDQRVAGLSHIVLAPGKCKLPLQEALDLLETWKQEIGDDKEKFAERARSDSHCPTAAGGGDLGFVVRANLDEKFDQIIFKEEPGKVYGPITTQKGLHLIFLHSCREPTSKGEATLGLPFSFGNLGKKPEDESEK